MSAVTLVVLAAVLFIVAYIAYGGYLAKKWGIDSTRKTPAHTMYDGVDYVPAKAPVVLGHHFASIAGAAPIIGPVTAAIFGWLPVFLWIVVGGIFIGAVHDFGALFASVRHGGHSIGDIIEKNLGKSGKKLFAIFAWFTLVLVVAAFTIVTSNTFVGTPSAATSSILFMVLAIMFGFATNRFKIPLGIATVAGVVLLFLCVVIGINYPIILPGATWSYILLGYIFVASVTPVWILLQPRDYLNSFLLYALLGGAFVGLIVANPRLEFAAVTSLNTNLGYMFPILFVTVACGAISGFHSMVSSGTTAKQLNNEKDARVVGYGGMLIESFLAVIALITAAILMQDKYVSLLDAGGPVGVFSAGVGSFLAELGIPAAAGTSFAALAVSAFALTSLDTATRLGRFVFQELFANDSQEGNSNLLVNKYFATLITVFAGGTLALSGGWKTIWPIFGAANQLLAALALLAISVWLANRGQSNSATKYPMFFMFAVTLSALVFVFISNYAKANYLLAVIAVLLFVLALVLLTQALKVLFGGKKTDADIGA
ncbi:MAG: carbon starvation protein A [Firmicutes bacterium]|nr:carbon starvation protein A [Bacillota bacterium]